MIIRLRGGAHVDQDLAETATGPLLLFDGGVQLLFRDQLTLAENRAERRVGTREARRA